MNALLSSIFHFIYALHKPLPERRLRPLDEQLHYGDDLEGTHDVCYIPKINMFPN